MTRRVDDEIARAAAELDRAGIDSARADAEWLLAGILGVGRGMLLIADDLDDDVAAAYRAAVGRRARREPLQHITGVAAFGAVDLAVGPGVFVPRPETEWLLTWAIARLAEGGDGAPRIADLCSGSGALALGIGAGVPNARIYAVERSPAALMWLRRNADGTGAARARGATVDVIAADVTDPDAMSTAIAPGSLDLVVSNPPYVPTAAAVSPEVRADPAEAVFAGADGLAVIAPMAEVVAGLLRPGGAVGIEHDDTTADEVAGVLAATGAFADIRAHRDLAGRPRFVTARRDTGTPVPSGGPHG